MTHYLRLPRKWFSRFFVRFLPPWARGAGNKKKRKNHFLGNLRCSVVLPAWLWYILPSALEYEHSHMQAGLEEAIAKDREAKHIHIYRIS